MRFTFSGSSSCSLIVASLFSYTIDSLVSHREKMASSRGWEEPYEKLPLQALSKYSDLEHMMTLWTGNLMSPPQSMTKSQYFCSLRNFATALTSARSPGFFDVADLVTFSDFVELE